MRLKSKTGKYVIHANVNRGYVDPRDFIYDESNITGYFYFDNTNFIFNSPEKNSYSFENIQSWVGMSITDNVYENLYNFWNYAQNQLSNFEIYALVFDENKARGNSNRLVAINVSKNVNILNGRKVIGYLFPGEIITAIHNGVSFNEFTSKIKIRVFVGSVKKFIKEVTCRIKRYIGNEYLFVQISNTDYFNHQVLESENIALSERQINDLIKLLKKRFGYYLYS